MNLSNMTPAQQARALGLVVGDTIEGKQGEDGYCVARLTLLWLGDRTTVWRTTERYGPNRPWTEPKECTNWTLEHREWVKISSKPTKQA